MPDKHVYLPAELFEKVSNMDRGEFSKICQNAVKEYLDIKKKTPEEIKAKLNQLKYEKQRQEKEEEILQEQLKQAEGEKAEKERQEREKDQKAQQKYEEKIKVWNDVFNEELGRDITKEEIESYQQSSYPTVWHFVDKIKGK